jgi:glycosyltransferase involved in cell wall biosynthesis
MSHPPFKIAVWMQLFPGQLLIGEGIPHHLSRLLKGWAKRDDVAVTLYAPHWSRETVTAYLQHYKVEAPHIKTSFVTPPPSKIDWFANKLQAANQLSNQHAQQAAPAPPAPSTPSTPSPTAPADLPRLSLFQRLFVIAKRYGRKAFPTLSRKFYAYIVNRVFPVMADIVNKDAPDVCFTSYGGWETVTKVRAPIVAAIPDLSFIEFPEFFDMADVAPAIRDFRRVSAKAAAILSISDHVRRRHVVDYLKVPEDRTFLTPHAAMTVDHALDGIADTGAFLKAYLANDMPNNPVQKVFLDHPRWGPVLQNTALLEDRPYLFYATQYRPYKNIFNLIRAVDQHNRTATQKIRLILTADISAISEIMDYIDRHDLFDSIVPLTRVPPAIHAALYKHATLTLAPTLFEGGFPFLFTESLSVGTPVLMSRIPLTMETLPEDIQPIMLFDPHNVDAMATRIGWALSHRAELLALQMPIYIDMAKRTWDDVAADHLAAFRWAASHPRGEEDCAAPTGTCCHGCGCG